MIILKNKWFRFALASVVWVLVFVVWMRNLWMLMALPLIFDWYVTKFFSRYVLVYHRRLRERNKIYKTVSEWVEAIVFAAVAAQIIHIFIFQMFTIPTPSMEKSLLVGDYLYVSKLTYGPRMPNTPLSMPLVHNIMPFTRTVKSYSEAIKRPYKRLTGLRPVERGDVVVFNWPADTLVLRPVDKRENYVKRCVGLPGDTLEIVNSELRVNGLVFKDIPGLQRFYYVTVTEPFSRDVLENMGISRADVMYNDMAGEYFMPLTVSSLEKIRAMKTVLYIEELRRPYNSAQPTFPADNRDWTETDFGPLWIPAKGATVDLTLENLPLYRRIIDVYEDNDLRTDNGTIYINDLPSNSYTFKMNYYWMMGDNRQNSLDSRYWGFVPEDHIVGKASFVWLSLDPEKGLFNGKVRWNKMLKKIR